jgi:hypothetical protein
MGAPLVPASRLRRWRSGSVSGVQVEGLLQYRRLVVTVGVNPEANRARRSGDDRPGVLSALTR